MNCSSGSLIEATTVECLELHVVLTAIDQPRKILHALFAWGTYEQSVQSFMSLVNCRVIAMLFRR